MSNGLTGGLETLSNMRGPGLLEYRVVIDEFRQLNFFRNKGNYFPSAFNSLLRLAGWLQRGEILDEVAQLGPRQAGGQARRHYGATFGALLDVLRLHRSYFSGGKVADA